MQSLPTYLTILNLYGGVWAAPCMLSEPNTPVNGLLRSRARPLKTEYHPPESVAL